MTVQLIGVGSQNRLRQVLQTNMDILKEELDLLKVETTAMPAVADTQQRLQQLVAEALSAGRSVVIAGGIGEGDDLTVSTVCKGLSAQVTEDQLSHNQIMARYKAAGEPVPQGIRSGVRVPVGATVFRSRTGGYPGSAVSSGGQCIIMLPDDPAELRGLLDTHVFAYLSEMAGVPAVRRRIGVAGLPAAQVSQTLQDLTAQNNPQLTVAADAGEVLVRVTALGQSLGEAANLGAAAVEAVKARLGSCVYGVDVDGIAHVLAAMLKEKNAAVAVAEAGTNRCLAARLERYEVLADKADTTGSKAKEGLGIPVRRQKEMDGQELAVTMADAIRRRSGAALGIGIAAEEQENGRQVVCLALTDRKHAWIRRLSVNSSNPAFVQKVAANQALNMARLYTGYYNEILSEARELTQFLPKDAPAAGLLGSLKGKGFQKNKRSHSAAQEETAMKQSKSGNTKAKAKTAWWTRFIPVKGDDMRELIRKGIFWLAIIVFICSVTYILGVQKESVNNEKLTQELGNLIVNDEDYIISDGYPEGYLTKFAALWDRNDDVAGWIEVVGTQLNYPVVQARNNKRYERTDFDGNNNNHGIPFVDYRVDQKKPSTNTIIYAHNMNDGQMFGELMNYKKLAYYKEHPTFRYDSVYKENDYKILGVFLVTANDPEFLYHNMIDMNEAELTDFVNQVRARSLINTKIDVKTSDKFVTLSTCDYSFKDAQGNRVARFVVVGRAVRDGEDPAVDTSVVTLNANPVMPTEWYEQIKRNQEAAELAAAEAASQAALESVDPNQPSAWLTPEEIESLLSQGYSEEDLLYFAEERRFELYNWLTEEEMTGLTALEKLHAMYSRRDKKWLSTEDRESLSENEKIEKVEANMAYAAQWLTEEEISKCRSWSEIEKAIQKKQESMCETEGCTLPKGHEGLHTTEKPCDANGCTLVKGHSGLHSNEKPCDTSGCTLPKGHSGLHSTEKPCDTNGCNLPKGHEGLHSNQKPCDTNGCTLPKGHKGLHSNEKACDTNGCNLPKGHEGLHSNEKACDTSGCTLPKGHSGLHSNESACSTSGCKLPDGHSGKHSNQCSADGCEYNAGHDGLHSNESAPPESSGAEESSEPSSEIEQESSLEGEENPASEEDEPVVSALEDDDGNSSDGE